MLTYRYVGYKKALNIPNLRSPQKSIFVFQSFWSLDHPKAARGMKFRGGSSSGGSSTGSSSSRSGSVGIRTGLFSRSSSMSGHRNLESIDLAFILLSIILFLHYTIFWVSVNQLRKMLHQSVQQTQNETIYKIQVHPFQFK